MLLAFKRNKIPRAAVGWAIALLAAVDLWTILRLYWVFSAPAAQLYASDAVIDYVKRDPQPARVVALQLGFPGRDPNLTGDGLMVHDVRNALGYHGNQLGRYDKLLDREEGYKELLNPNVRQLLNMKFALVDIGDMSHLFADAKLVAGPVKDAAGVSVYLFRLAGDNPYAWVVPIIVKAPDEAVLGTLLDRRFDVRRAGLFDSTSAVKGAANVTTLPEPLAVHATVRHYEPGRVSIFLDAPAPPGSALIVSENHYPGWEATVDGKPAVVARADYTLIGVQLPEGARSIDLKFSSGSYKMGKMITMVALLAALVLAGAGVVAERRKVG